MKNKKILIIFSALCCMLLMSACEKKQDNTGNTPSNTTASKAEEKSGEPTVIDVFSELNVTFEGENGSGEIICEYTGDSDFIKYDVEFKGDRNGRYKNGDTAIVKLDYSDLRAENAKVFFKEKEKEYTVEGLWGVILSVDGYDFSECTKALEERMFDKESSYSKIREFDVGNTFTTHYVDGQADVSEWTILSAEYEPIQGKLIITSSDKALNEYTIYYKVTLLGEKSREGRILEEAINSRYSVGDKREWTYIIGETTQNVFVERDSNVVKTNPDVYISVSNGDKSMSKTEIYSPSEIEYTDNFDEYYGKKIYLNIPNYDIYDVEIK